MWGREKRIGGTKRFEKKQYEDERKEMPSITAKKGIEYTKVVKQITEKNKREEGYE